MDNLEKRNSNLKKKYIKFSSDQKKAISICFFNNKGGVGKTTLIANLAAQLSLRQGQKILLIDADPQCNLSQYLLSDAEFLDVYDDESEALKGTIFDIIHPLSLGKGYSKNLPIRKINNFGVDAILGDPRLALKEDLLAQDWREAKAGGIRGLRTTFVFSNLIDRVESDYDFILFDMGPSLGAINRSILLSVENFIVPASIDIFSVWGIKNIGNALAIWKKELNLGLSMAEDPEELQYGKSGKKIHFLGYVTQQHKEKSENGEARTVQAYENIKSRLPERIKVALSQFYPKENFLPHLGDVKHLSSLAPKSQDLHTPMIDVALTGSYTSMRKKAREIFLALSERLIANLNSKN